MDLQGRDPSLSHTEKEKEEKEVGGDAGIGRRTDTAQGKHLAE